MAQCDLADLQTAAACINCLSTKEKLAAEIYYLALTLDALRGDNLTAIGDLVDAIACYDCEPEAHQDSFRTVIAQDSAIQSGAIGAALDINALRDAIKCLACLPERKLRTAEMLLLCKILEAGVPA